MLRAPWTTHITDESSGMRHYDVLCEEVRWKQPQWISRNLLREYFYPISLLVQFRNILYFCQSYLIFWFWFTCGHGKILLDPRSPYSFPVRGHIDSIAVFGERRSHLWRLIWSKSFFVHDLIILSTRPSSRHLAWLGRI